MTKNWQRWLPAQYNECTVCNNKSCQNVLNVLLSTLDGFNFWIMMMTEVSKILLKNTT
jgi:hypothetical protein